MAFVPEFACGFEMGAVPLRAGKVIISPGSVTPPSVAAAAVHTGIYGLSMNRAGIYVYLDAALDELHLAAWCYPNTNYKTNHYRIGMEAAGAPRVEVKYDNGYWDVWLDGAKVADGSVATTPSAWQHVQLYAKLNAVGTIQTIIEGTPDITYNGDTSGASVDNVRVHYTGVTASYLDDFVVGAGGWSGDLRIDPLVVDADTATIEWVPSGGGDNYADVDGIPPDAPYVHTDADASDLYTLADWDDTDGEGTVVKDPIGVTVWAQVRKEDASLDDQFRMLESDGANEVNSGYRSILTSYEHHDFLRTATPAGGVWSKSDIDGLKVGIEADLV